MQTPYPAIHTQPYPHQSYPYPMPPAQSCSPLPIHAIHPVHSISTLSLPLPLHLHLTLLPLLLALLLLPHHHILLLLLLLLLLLSHRRNLPLPHLQRRHLIRVQLARPRRIHPASHGLRLHIRQLLHVHTIGEDLALTLALPLSLRLRLSLSLGLRLHHSHIRIPARCEQATITAHLPLCLRLLHALLGHHLHLLCILQLLSYARFAPELKLLLCIWWQDALALALQVAEEGGSFLLECLTLGELALGLRDVEELILLHL